MRTDPCNEAIALSISGMTCGGCASTVERLLMRVPGVQRAQVDHRTGRAVVSGTAPAEQLIAAVEAAGYGVQRSAGDTAQASPHEHSASGCC